MKTPFTNVQVRLRETRKGWWSTRGLAREIITLGSTGKGEGIVTRTKKLSL